MHCPQCSFDDNLELQRFEVEVETRKGEVRKVELILVVCKVCGNVYVANWRATWED